MKRPLALCRSTGGCLGIPRAPHAMLKHALIAGLLLGSSPGLVWGQNPLPARQTILLQNPARPATVKASVVSGNLVVTGYDEKEILVETTVAGHPPSSKDQARDGERNSPASDFRPAGLSVKEQDNVVSISLLPTAPPMDLWVYVPRSARLKLNNLASGDLRVEKVAGETEVSIVNGSLFLTNVSGAVVAHAVNGRINVDCASIVPAKPMTLSSVNGNIQITLPARCQAQVKLESLTGRIACEFEIQKFRTGGPSSVNEASPGESPLPGLPGKTMAGTMNGGGPQITVKTVNGSIEIKKK
jgi:hypothetical protein